MGALHEGHKKLVTEAAAHADRVVVSIYVNPLQFGQGEDFEQYPRDLASDAGFLEEAGVGKSAPQRLTREKSARSLRGQNARATLAGCSPW